MGRFFKTILFLVPIGIGYLFYTITKPDPVPILEDAYWGPKSDYYKEKKDTSVHPFEIDISDEIISDLKERLKRELESNRLVAPLENVGFEYGFNSKFLTKTVGYYWLTKYDWRNREKLLNKYSQYKTKIGGLDIHFYHVKPKPQSENGGKTKTRAILMFHGWPGSVVEYQKIIPLLSEPKGSLYNYELIIPSLPGFGFSSASARPGLGTPEMSNIFKRLMQRLGFEKYFVLGGDWGSFIIADMATLYPDNVIAAHSTSCIVMSNYANLRNILALTFPSVFIPEEFRKYASSFSEFVSFQTREMGYAHIQATKPDTVGTALTHSPLGLAAYILEKFSTWTNRTWISREDGGILDNFSLDELLDNVMIYWVTGSITTSQRLYSENLIPARKPLLDSVPTDVPFDCQIFSGDLNVIPEFVARIRYKNIQRFTVYDKGGHFAAFEVPEIVAAEAVSYFNTL